MFRNYLVTALRNLARNRLYGAISILGLAVAFASAILIGQFVRGEFGYDRWVPGRDRVYAIANVLQLPGRPPNAISMASTDLAARLKAQLPRGVVAARLLQDFLPEDFLVVRRRPSDPAVREHAFAWADPDIFKVFPLPVLAGNPRALEQPDTLVLTRRMARKYFGRDAPIGETLQVGSPDDQGKDSIIWHTMRVAAVLKDLPVETNLNTEIFASGRSAYSRFAYVDRTDFFSNFTFVRLPDRGSAADLDRALDVAAGPNRALFAALPGARFAFRALPISELHLTSTGQTSDAIKPIGSRSFAYAISAIATLIVLVAAINFVTLLTARASRRAMEVGVRKAAGARRIDLMAQFIGEALIQVALSALVAAGLAEILARPFGTFVQRDLGLDFLHDPLLVAGLAATAFLVGLLAAIYPALVLSSFRPAAVLKGGSVQMAGSAMARQALVVAQFAVLIGLMVTTTTLYRQTAFALARGIGGGEGGSVLRVLTPQWSDAFPSEMRKLPGVGAVAGSSEAGINTPGNMGSARVQVAGGWQDFLSARVDFGFLDLYFKKPLAGRLFSRAHPEDDLFPRFEANPTKPVYPLTAVLNETAARRLGFSDPGKAVGQVLTLRFGQTIGREQIIGVVADAPITVRSKTEPMVYICMSHRGGSLSIKLTGQDVPGTLKAIDSAWRRTGHTQPIQSALMSQVRLDLYRDLIVQGTTIALCAGLAVLIACLGLFGLSAYATERRTKEIGVRKAMGADSIQVVLLLLWQFTVPVLVAAAIAMPVGFLAMNWWLHGFAYHVDLTAWTFAMAAAAAVLIAWGTVSWQSFIVARAKPATALRYE
jgi:putative ABC transport system permease protein